MEVSLLNLFGFFAFLKTFFSPKSEIFTPKRDDEHPRPFHMGIPHPPLPEKKSSSYSRLHSYKSYKQRLEQLEIIDLLSLEIFQRYSQFCKLTLPASPKRFARVTFISKGLCNNHQKEGGGGGGRGWKTRWKCEFYICIKMSSHFKHVTWFSLQNNWFVS